jgi:hypothetical protein
MKILLLPNVAVILEAIAGEVRGLEFSGFGYARMDPEQNALIVYDFVLLHVGSSSYTEISSQTMLELSEHPDAKNMRVWIHKHPIGSQIPGYHNWSTTDENTIKQTPLGSVPQLVGWSASIVRTPRGWVGRIDNHIKNTTMHVEVEPNIPVEIFDKVQELEQKRWSGLVKPPVCRKLQPEGNEDLFKTENVDWTPEDDADQLTFLEEEDPELIIHEMTDEEYEQWVLEQEGYLDDQTARSRRKKPGG